MSFIRWLFATAAAATLLTPPELIPFEKHTPSGKRLWGYADAAGQLVIDARFDVARRFGPDGFAAIKRDGKWGMVDRQGREVIPPRNSYQVPMVNGLVGACMDTDKPVPGLTVLGPKPGQHSPVMESKCGYFDAQGKIAIPFTYDWIHPFSEGVAPVTNSRHSTVCPAVDEGRATLYGMINTKGALVLPIEHCYVG